MDVLCTVLYVSGVSDNKVCCAMLSLQGLLLQSTQRLANQAMKTVAKQTASLRHSRRRLVHTRQMLEERIGW